MWDRQIKTGEIGDDLTYYFASSEQVPSAVGLGVLMEKDILSARPVDLSCS